MNLSRSYVLQAFMEKPWAILPNKLAIIEEIVMRHVTGEKLSAEEIQARVNGGIRAEERQIRNVAILPLFGVIFPRANMVDNISGPGGTSAERFGQSFSKLMNDPAIDAIVIDINSPGGQVGGVQEVSKKIFESRGAKPIIAVANPLTASAAYWIGSAADELVVTPSGDVGSIGVYAVHEDISAALEQEGIKISIISAGKYKVEANQYQPLSEEARTAIQSDVDEIYDTFVNDVARNRGASPDVVRNSFGEGRTVMAEQAVKIGMADRVATLDDVVNGLLSSKEPNISGQAPASNARPAMQEARARLEMAGQKTFEGDFPMIRELLKQRAEKLARAQAIWDIAEKENREMTEAENAEFVQLLGEGDSTGEIGALDAKIEKLQGQREQLRAAAEKKFVEGKDSIKPDDQDSDKMKRAEFEKMSPAAQAAYAKGGGKIED
jgi:capsid assembly protease